MQHTLCFVVTYRPTAQLSTALVHVASIDGVRCTALLSNWKCSSCCCGQRACAIAAAQADWDIVKRGWDAHVLGKAPHTFTDPVKAIKTLRVSQQPLNNQQDQAAGGPGSRNLHAPPAAEKHWLSATAATIGRSSRLLVKQWT